MSTLTSGSATTAASPATVQAADLTKKVEQARTKSKAINLATWGVAIGVMIYGTVNVTMLLIQHHVPVLIAPLLSLMVDLGLIVALVAAPVLADYGRKSGWVNTLRWVTALMSWGLNITEPALKGDGVGIGIHSCGPLLLIVVAEAGAALQRTLAGIVAELEDTLATAAQAAPKAKQALADLQAKLTAARGELAEMQAKVEQETARAEEAIAARAEVESRAAATAAEVENAAGKQVENLARAQEEIQRLHGVVADAVETRDAALRRADEQTQAAGRAEGRLAEARDAAERAVTAKATAEQDARTRLQEMSAAAGQAEHRLSQQLEAAMRAAETAEHTAAERAERVRVLEAQREEARAAAERAATARVLAEQEITDLQRGRDAALNELERVRRQLARATEKAGLGASRQVEIATRGEVEISTRPERKSALPVPVELPENLPAVESVRPEKVATVLIAKAIYREATYAELADATAVSSRTVGTILRTVPKDLAEEIGEQLLALAGGGQVLALTDGRAA